MVIFLLATARVSAPIDGDIQSVSEPIAGVVLMLMAGFAPYMTYKAINFMGFDMYHAMSAEQEGKAALNRPMPIPMNRAPSSQPSKVLDGGTGGGGSGGSGGSPTPPAPTTGHGPSTGTAGASSGGGGAAAGGAAAGGVAAGAVVAKEAATAGVRTGKAVGGAASQQSDAASQTPTAPAGAPLPPHVADSIPAQANGKKG